MPGEEFARTIPAYVVARVLGSPPEDCRRTVDMVKDYFDALYESEERAIQLMGVMTKYAEDMRQEKLRNPGDDMFTELAKCLERGEVNQAEYLHGFS